MMERRYKQGDEVRVRAAISLPADCTEQDLREWLRFQFRSSGMLSSNPLADYDMEAHGVEFD